MKTLVLLCVAIFAFFFQNAVFADCQYSGEIIGSLESCLGETDLVSPGDGEIGGGIKSLFVNWTLRIVTALSLIAIGSMAYGGFLLSTAFGEDEKIKKGKDVVKWAMYGFLAAISAGGVVRIVIEIIFAVTR